jgi:hypothetical protein
MEEKDIRPFRPVLRPFRPVNKISSKISFMFHLVGIISNII